MNKIFFLLPFCIVFSVLVFSYIRIMNEGRYNLRNRKECCIPIQLQLASDTDFLMGSGDRADSPQSGQVGFTDLSDSGSDIDIDALGDHSDQNLSSNSHVSKHQVHNAGKGQAPHT